MESKDVSIASKCGVYDRSTSNTRLYSSFGKVLIPNHDLRKGWGLLTGFAINCTGHRFSSIRRLLLMLSMCTFCVCICAKQISMLSSVNINPARTNHRPIIHVKTNWTNRYIIQYKTNLNTYTIVSYHPSPARPFLPHSYPSKPWDCVIVNHHTFWNIWHTSIICRIWQETKTWLVVSTHPNWTSSPK